MNTLKFAPGILVAVAAWLPTGAAAHHSAVAYDRDTTTVISGTVRRLNWRNPHVTLEVDVSDDNGETVTWRIEGNQPSSWIALGVDRDAIRVGAPIRVAVNPYRNGRPGGFVAGLSIPDGPSFGMESTDGGSAMVLERRLPSLTEYEPPPEGENWREREARYRPQALPIPEGRFDTGYPMGALDPANLAATRPEAPFDLTGTWEFRAELEGQAHYGLYEFKPMPELTPKAQRFYDEYLRHARAGESFGEPSAECYPVGMPRYMTRYGPILMLQYPTAIYMVNRLNNEYRVIYLDGRERMPEDKWEPNWNGESIGRWDGDTLVVETKGFTDDNHIIQQGVLTGDQLQITERISMLNDGNTLKIDFILTDPEHWVGEWKHTKFRDRTLNYDVLEASCVPARDKE